MSTPAYLMSRSPSPFPFHELKEDQLQFLSPHQPSSSHSSLVFFPITHDHTASQQKADNCMVHGGPRDDHRLLSSSSSLETTVGHEINGHKLSNHKADVEDENKSAAKWMSSKMRLTQKLMRAGCAGTDHHHHNREQAERNVMQKLDHDEDHQHQNNMMIRVCADCSTTRTPLWRSGPQGPKSLCNACGIRQRKARRAMAAANDTILSTTNASTTKIKVQIKEKKSRQNSVPQCQKKPLKLTHHSSSGEGKLSFEAFALSLSNVNSSGAFPKDEEDAAILLMALSCGLINS